MPSDIGDKFGYIQAILEVGLMCEELHPLLVPYLQKLVDGLKENDREEVGPSLWGT